MALAMVSAMEPLVCDSAMTEQMLRALKHRAKSLEMAGDGAHKGVLCTSRWHGAFHYVFDVARARGSSF